MPSLPAVGTDDIARRQQHSPERAPLYWGSSTPPRTIYGLDQALSHAVGDAEPIGQCVARVAEQVEAQAVIANALEVVNDRLRRERDQGRAEGLQGGAMLLERLQLNRAVRPPSAVAVTTFSQLESVA